MGLLGRSPDSGDRVHAWWLVSAPVDFRCGADRLLVHVREVLKRNPLGAPLCFAIDRVVV